ncbi:SusD-like starch-binding protein associating with outer membrane [Chitinophaga skermanii]|uniref:SusD-like starch-binding protein associating with outer membrane n=1 Tax=Chitinophaga skermanii TaxID=331697 RepID=A0A327QVV5_9BACT|nr:RagB/SusD family nutrient uptake outer membrane protein [Chitinophaga skermanii]RAJ08796.1 SusD-like starch-binding protein associating with outer membrane [Chitinophaga skermanii]
MKKLLQWVLCGAVMLSATSCKKYLEIIPRGQKIPQTLADFKALMEHKDAHTVDYSNQVYVSNEFKFMLSTQASNTIANINYNWQEDKDRVSFLQTDYGYTSAYKGIFINNVVINHMHEATTGTAEEKAAVVAQAKTNRAMMYFYLVNSYAKTYDAATAATDPGVLINTKDEMEQTLKQATVKEVYEFMIKDLNEAIPNLPEVASSPFIPGKGTAYALLARINMFMRNYTDAKGFADKALASNNTLYDWVKLYYDNKKVADSTAPSINVGKFEFTNTENYTFNYGGSIAQLQGFYISFLQEADSSYYDAGDARFKINFAKRKVGAETIWSYRRMDDPNVGGIRTPEMYYIKAECLAREGKPADAMLELDKVRRKRIITEFFTPSTATTEAQAIANIRRELRNEYRGTGLPYLDYRRFNVDPVYKATLTKNEYGTIYSITPESHIWIIPFSQVAINYSEGQLTQNSK